MTRAGEGDAALRGRPLWLAGLRVVSVTGLLGGAGLVRATSSSAVPVDPYFTLIAVTYGLTAIRAGTVRYAERARWLVVLQIGADAVLVAGIVLVTGGIAACSRPSSSCRWWPRASWSAAMPPAPTQTSPMPAMITLTAYCSGAYIQPKICTGIPMRTDPRTIFLIQEIHPSALKEKGLASMLREYIFQWESRNDAEISLKIENERRLPLEIEQAFYRIIQEALANITRHSCATHVDISLLYQKNEIHASISDNGCGFDVSMKSSGLGLRSIRERIESVHGTCQIESAPQKGTRLQVQAPIESPENEE